MSSDELVDLLKLLLELFVESAPGDRLAHPHTARIFRRNRVILHEVLDAVSENNQLVQLELNADIPASTQL